MTDRKPAREEDLQEAASEGNREEDGAGQEDHWSRQAHRLTGAISGASERRRRRETASRLPICPVIHGSCNS